MKFKTVVLTDNVLEATAEGYAGEVNSEFYRLAALTLGSQGPWQITEVTGVLDLNQPESAPMTWILRAKVKGR